jgi:hypothetical protein
MTCEERASSFSAGLVRKRQSKKMEITGCEIRTVGRVVDSLPAMAP